MLETTEVVDAAAWLLPPPFTKVNARFVGVAADSGDVITIWTAMVAAVSETGVRLMVAL